MRSAILSKAKQITVPALVFQADLDKAVVPAATREFYDALASQDKQWITYPSYCHDSQFENEPEQLVNDILAWIRKHAPEQA
jgi:alpha-beta hydrolase superfamily lysophospholipase